MPDHMIMQSQVNVAVLVRDPPWTNIIPPPLPFFLHSPDVYDNDIVKQWLGGPVYPGKSLLIAVGAGLEALVVPHGGCS